MAVLFSLPPSEVARWPAQDLDLIERFMIVEPHPLTRIEVALATLLANYDEVHKAKGAARASVSDYLPYHNGWEKHIANARYSETDLSIMKALGTEPVRQHTHVHRRRQRAVRTLKVGDA